MSCTPLTPRHLAVLAACADRLDPPEGHEPELDELRRRGLVMPQSTELTGNGWAHVGKVTGGVLS